MKIEFPIDLKRSSNVLKKRNFSNTNRIINCMHYYPHVVFSCGIIGGIYGGVSVENSSKELFSGNIVEGVILGMTNGFLIGVSSPVCLPVFPVVIVYHTLLKNKKS